MTGIRTREMNSTVKVFSDAGAKMFQPPGEAPDFFIRTGERRVIIQNRDVFFLIYNYACLTRAGRSRDDSWSTPP